MYEWTKMPSPSPTPLTEGQYLARQLGPYLWLPAQHLNPKPSHTLQGLKKKGPVFCGYLILFIPSGSYSFNLCRNRGLLVLDFYWKRIKEVSSLSSNLTLRTVGSRFFKNPKTRRFWWGGGVLWVNGPRTGSFVGAVVWRFPEFGNNGYMYIRNQFHGFF